MITPKQYNYNLYFDYDGLIFNYISPDPTYTISYSFTTDNNYINYKLQPFLNRISPIFLPSYNIYSENPLGIYSYNANDDFMYITNTGINYTEYYLPYTFINVYSTTQTGVLLIYEVDIILC